MKTGRISLILLSLLAILTGCTDPVTETGTLTISMDNRTRGLSIIDMETRYYLVDVLNTDKSITYDQIRLEESAAAYPMTVASGNTEVSVSAYNRDNVEIGRGTSSINVVPNRNNSVDVRVEEIPGKADLIIEIDTSIKGVDFIAEIQKSQAGAVSLEIPLTAGPNGILRGRMSLDSGFYLVRIRDGNGNYYGKVESVRIFKDADITYRADVGEDRFNVSIEIHNAIVPTPSVAVEGGKAQYTDGESYSLTAISSGITDPTYQWLIDDNAVVNGNTATITGTLPHLAAGRHYFTVIVRGSDVQWVGNHEFTINRGI